MGMVEIKLRGELLFAFVGCVTVGAEGLPDGGAAILASLEAAESPLEGPDVGYAVIRVPAGAMDGLRSAFTVGWEGLDPGDGLYGQADEVARVIGVGRAGPRP